jgi:hypothetical protein
MLEDIRKSYGLTRQELADMTHRSVNYILKAEQATFPCAPIALTDFYAQPNYDGAVPLRIPWEPMDRDVMQDAYRDFQRRHRIAWLQDWEPDDYTAGLPFRRKWLKRLPEWEGNLGSGAAALSGSFSSRVKVYPSQYAISSGLCLPAAVIYRNEKDLTHAGSIVTCMEDLVEYVLSGQYRAEYLSFEGQMALEAAILRIAKEEGVKTNDGSTFGTAA